MCREEKRLLKIIHSFTDNVIRNRRKEHESTKKLIATSKDLGIKKRLAFIDLLLEAKTDGRPLTDKEIRDEVDTFMFGGHDTTSVAVSFCLLNIAKHPEVQANVFEEIDLILGNNGDSLTIKDLNSLQYLEKVIKESLRLYPSVAFMGRKMPEETKIGDYLLPNGCDVYISPYLMGRDEKLFPEPLKFKPERFDHEVTKEKVNPFAYIPFSAGKCIIFESFH
jgi:cytochrome P450 family 4